jgi:putative PIG3 family NAD(P)H quinone oxidoreductase
MENGLMRAVTIEGPGGADNLKVCLVPSPPRPTADRVLVRVRAAALNRADILQRKGLYPAPLGAVQNIPGLEFAGEVDQIGDEVHAFRVGQRVFGITAGGAQAEYVVVPESALVEIPENLDWAEAAAVPEVFITAHDALFTQAGLTVGERVLIHAAGSGVGTAAVQLAHAAGAIVYGTSRKADKLERVREYGLNEGVAVGEDPTRFADAVREWTSGAGVNVVLDLVGGPYFASNIASLAVKGRMMLVGTTGGATASFEFGTVLGKRLRITGTVLRARSTEEKATATRLFAAQIVPLLARGSVRPVIDKIFSLGEVSAAHERMESNESFGKIVLMV